MEPGVFSRLIDTERFMPHGYCFLWDPQLLWLHVVSDLAVALAYFSIPISIAVLLHRRGRIIPYRWVFVMFAIFIFLCGMTHVVEIITLWQSYYYLQGIVKALTAAASVATAVMIYPLMPVLLDQLSALQQEREGGDKQ